MRGEEIWRIQHNGKSYEGRDHEGAWRAALADVERELVPAKERAAKLARIEPEYERLLALEAEYKIVRDERDRLKAGLVHYRRQLRLQLDALNTLDHDDVAALEEVEALVDVKITRDESHAYLRLETLDRPLFDEIVRTRPTLTEVRAAALTKLAGMLGDTP